MLYWHLLYFLLFCLIIWTRMIRLNIFLITICKAFITITHWANDRIIRFYLLIVIFIPIIFSNLYIIPITLVLLLIRFHIIIVLITFISYLLIHLIFIINLLIFTIIIVPIILFFITWKLLCIFTRLVVIYWNTFINLI